MCVRSFLAACFTFLKDLYVLYKVGFYEFFWAFMYVFVSRWSKDISNETILITGTGSGIGRDLALKMALMGNVIICVDINGEANKQTVRDILTAGGQAHGYTCDISVFNDVTKLHEKTIRDVGRVSYLFNVAGVVAGKKFRQLLPEDIKRTIDVNVLSVLWVTQQFIEDMIDLGYGHVTTISSVAGLFGSPKLVDYSCSKFAIMGFMEALKMEIKQEKIPIDFTVVNPFFIRTGMFDGASSKWPFFMPILETGYVGDKIIQAVQHNRNIVVMPRIFYYLMLVKAFCPDRLSVQVNKFMGTFEVMEDFRGRVESPNPPQSNGDTSTN